MDAQPMVKPVDAAPCGQVRPFIDFLVERFASQPEHPCYRAARRLSAFDGQRATFEGTAASGAKRTDGGISAPGGRTDMPHRRIQVSV
jgi:hypothetical protein